MKFLSNIFNQASHLKDDIVRKINGIKNNIFKPKTINQSPKITPNNYYNNISYDFKYTDLPSMNGSEIGGVDRLFEEASKKSGININAFYLIAGKESGFNPNARADAGKTNAEGLFQFVSGYKTDVIRKNRQHGINEKNYNAFDPRQSTVCFITNVREFKEKAGKKGINNPSIIDMYCYHASPNYINYMDKPNTPVSKMVGMAAMKNPVNKNLFFSNGRELTVGEFRDKLFASAVKNLREFGIDLSNDYKNNKNSPTFSLNSPIFSATRTFQLSNLNNDKFISYTKSLYENTKNIIGTRYKYGGENSLTGFDCSAFTKYAFSTVGINLPRTAAEQFNATKNKMVSNKIDLSQMKPGDLIFLQGTQKGMAMGQASHVAVYLGGGRIMHSGSSRGVVTTDIPQSFHNKILAVTRPLEHVMFNNVEPNIIEKPKEIKVGKNVKTNNNTHKSNNNIHKTNKLNKSNNKIEKNTKTKKVVKTR